MQDNTVQFKKYWDWGLRGGMIDFGERIREDMLFSNGMTGDEMHNYYSLVYAKTYFDAWSAAMGNDFITFERSACARKPSICCELFRGSGVKLERA